MGAKGIVSMFRGRKSRASISDFSQDVNVDTVMKESDALFV